MKRNILKKGFLILLLIIGLSSVSVNIRSDNSDMNSDENTLFDQSVSILSDEDDVPDY